MSIVLWLCFVWLLCPITCGNSGQQCENGAGGFGYELIEYQLENLTLRLTDQISTLVKSLSATNERIDKLAATIAANNTGLSNQIATLNLNQKVTDGKIYSLTTNIKTFENRLSGNLQTVQETVEDKLEKNQRVGELKDLRLIDRLSKVESLGDSILQNQRSINRQITDITASVSTLDSQSKQILKNHIDLVINSCNDVTVSGVFRLKVPNINVCCIKAVSVGGWNLIQLRFDDGTSFYRDWSAYRDGFGTVGLYSSFWLGLEAIHQISNSGDYQLYIDITNESGETKYARYSKFKVAGGGDGYMLTVDGYSGTAGDQLSQHSNTKFSTFNKDNDKSKDYNCAKDYESGWWFTNCRNSNLNGPYKKGKKGFGIEWGNWADAATQSRMLIRRK